MNRMIIRITALLLVLTLVIPLVGCNGNAPSENQETSSNNDNDTSATTEVTDTSSDTSEDTSEEIVETENPETNEFELSAQQKNSFSMLYHLAITAEEIRISKNNRLLLDDIYTSLLNDINPGAIDETTQEHLQNLRDIIKSYIDISVKRERLQYIYNQDKAAAIHSAVPDPLAILSVTNSLNWKKLAVSAVYTVVDSYSNYKSASNTAEQNFIMSGWELDDEETKAIYKNRERAFDYMVDIVQEYHLDGLLTLNEESIEMFAEICAIESVQQKIRRLESEEETYKLLGNYWLELADCYYETSQYQKCLDCVNTYNDLSTGIYRKDYNYVQILPKVIVAAQETYTDNDYVANIAEYADVIIKNTNTEEWSVCYFAAQVYLDLYAKTNDTKYLKKAYNIAYDNIAILLDVQCDLNDTYLSNIVEIEVDEPDYSYMSEDEKKTAKEEYKEEKKRAKEYNKQLKEERKTELPPLYEPLILNCDLLFALADEMNITDKEKSEIEAILNGVFLSKPVNDRYSFSEQKEDYSIEFDKNEIVVPANLLSAEAKIIITVSEKNKSTTFDDCTITKVKREESKLESFNAYVTSKQMKKYEWTKNSKVTVQIYNGDAYQPIEFQYKIMKYKDNWLIPDKVVFKEE